jgi:hypothetical protein
MEAPLPALLTDTSAGARLEPDTSRPEPEGQVAVGSAIQNDSAGSIELVLVTSLESRLILRLTFRFGKLGYSAL